MTDSPTLTRVARVNRADANWVAEQFRTLPDVQDVYLFGGVARTGGRRQSDLDFILAVREDLAEEWLNGVLEYDRIRGLYTGTVTIRDMMTRRLIVGYDELLRTFGRQFNRRLDVFVFPPDWQSQIDRLQARGRHRDANFMQNVVSDALWFDPRAGSFDFPGTG